MPVTRQHADALIETVLAELKGMTYEVILPTADDFVKAARHLIYVLDGPTDPDGTEPGSYTTALIQAFLHADLENRRMLTRIYPAMGAHVHLFKTHPDAERVRHAIANLLIAD